MSDAADGGLSLERSLSEPHSRPQCAVRASSLAYSRWFQLVVQAVCTTVPQNGVFEGFNAHGCLSNERYICKI